MAEMVGVEPTRPCGPIAFRVRPLQPLEYISRIVLPNSNIVLQLNENGKEYLNGFLEKQRSEPCIHCEFAHYAVYCKQCQEKGKRGIIHL